MIILLSSCITTLAFWFIAWTLPAPSMLLRSLYFSIAGYAGLVAIVASGAAMLWVEAVFGLFERTLLTASLAVLIGALLMGLAERFVSVRALRRDLRAAGCHV